MRQLKHIIKNAKPLVSPPPLTVNALREQLPDMSPDDRKTMQKLLGDEKALEKALKESEASNASLKDLINNVIQSAESPNEFDSSFWASVRELIRETSGRHKIENRIENVPLFVNLFQIAKQSDAFNPQQRSRMLYQLGSYIYRLKMLRFDPVNEAEYLDALSTCTQPIQAITLWKSRRDRSEVADSVYWWDIGILYHLEAGLLGSACNLAHEMLEKFNYVSPRAACELIKVSKDQKEKQFWIQYLATAQVFPETEPQDITAKQNLQPNQLSGVFDALLAAGNWEMAQYLIETIQCESGSGFEPQFSLTRSSKRKPVGDLNSLCSTVITKFSQSLFDPQFYAFWIINHLRDGNNNQAYDILDAAREQEIRFGPEQVTLLLQQLLRGHHRVQARKLAVENDIPQVAVVYLDWLSNNMPADIPEYIESINCDLTPELAEKILETGAHISYPLLDMCLSHGCWKQFWGLMRENSHPNLPSPRESLALMFKSENYHLVLNLFETILQALVVAGDKDAVVAVLLYIESKHQLKPNKLLLSSIKSALSCQEPIGKTAQGDLPWPRQGPLSQSAPIEAFVQVLGADLEASKRLSESWS